MVAAMIRELEIRKDYLEEPLLHSIYFGGGTPSLLSGTQLEALFRAIHRHFTVVEGAEITLEANPDDISSDRLRVWKTLGINRLSIGIQSFHEDELRFMNRAHTGKEALEAVDLARGAGFDDLTIDLIYGIPVSDTSRWEQNLEQAISFQIPHLSAYCLTIEPGTAFGNWASKGKLQETPDAISIEQFLLTMDRLMDAGYEHYEISNYALPGREARHNSAYWQGAPYLGIGPSAHSYDGCGRQWNIAHNIKYVKALQQYSDSSQLLAWIEEEVLSAEDHHNEYILTRLRTARGINPDELATGFREVFENAVQVFVDQGHIVKERGVYRLTRSGKLIADAISAELFV